MSLGSDNFLDDQCVLSQFGVNASPNPGLDFTPPYRAVSEHLVVFISLGWWHRRVCGEPVVVCWPCLLPGCDPSPLSQAATVPSAVSFGLDELRVRHYPAVLPVTAIVGNKQQL